MTCFCCSLIQRFML